MPGAGEVARDDRGVPVGVLNGESEMDTYRTLKDKPLSICSEISFETSTISTGINSPPPHPSLTCHYVIEGESTSFRMMSRYQSICQKI